MGTRCAELFLDNCALTSSSRLSIKSHKEHIRSARSSSSGLGLGPATSARIRSSRARRPSSVSGSLAATVLINAHRPRLPMSEAWEKISGEDSRTALRSSLLAPLSPPSALSERASSALSLSFASFDSSSASVFTFSSPFSLAFTIPSPKEGCQDQNLHGLLQPLQESRAR